MQWRALTGPAYASLRGVRVGGAGGARHAVAPRPRRMHRLKLLLDRRRRIFGRAPRLCAASSPRDKRQSSIAPSKRAPAARVIAENGVKMQIAGKCFGAPVTKHVCTPH